MRGGQGSEPEDVKRDLELLFLRIRIGPYLIGLAEEVVEETRSKFGVLG